jgi:hypothetical protein
MALALDPPALAKAGDRAFHIQDMPMLQNFYTIIEKAWNC